MEFTSAGRSKSIVPRKKDISEKNWQEVNLSDLCGILGTTRATINAWKKLGMPCAEVDDKTVYSVRDVFLWKIDYEKEKTKTGTVLDGDLGGESTDALERYRTIKADQAKFDLEIKKGLFVERDKYEETLRKAATYARKYLQNLGKLLGVKLAKEKKTATIVKTIDGEVEGILRRMVEEFVPND